MLTKKFNEKSKVLGVRVPESQYETIKVIVNDFVDNFREDNPQGIKTIQDNVKEVLSIYLDIQDYINKELRIPKSKYLEILGNHNMDLVNNLLAKFPIERKQAVKTLSEESRERELKKKKQEEEKMKKLGRTSIFDNYPIYDITKTSFQKSDKGKKKYKKLLKR